MARQCFRKPIPEIFEAALMLERAVDAHNVGNKDIARTLLLEANMPEIWKWSESIWGREDPEIHLFRSLPNSPPTVPIDQRPKPRMPGAITKKQILQRDGYHCRFCGIPVISPEIRQKVRANYPDVVQWERNNAGQHAAFQCMWLQYDHLLPHQRGGESSIENIVITCGPCNFGRGKWTVEEAGLDNPLNRPIVANWVGFERWRGLTDFKP
jgi:5-methylcytosine-specific restriction endonuclease McrA